jgi:dipeptidase E
MTNNTAAPPPSIVALGSYQALKQTNVIDHVIRLSRSSAPNILDISDNTTNNDLDMAAFVEKGCTVKQCNANDWHKFKAWADVIIYRHHDQDDDDNVPSHDDLINAIHNGTVLCALPKILHHLLDAEEILPSDTAIIEGLDQTKIDNHINANKRVIAMDELAGFVIVGENAMTIGEEEGSATCHVYIRNESGESITGPLPTTWNEPIPIEEILQFPMPATASHLEALEDHVDTNFVIADDVLPKAALEEECNKDNNADEVFPKIVACGRTETLQMQAIVDKVIELSGTDLPKVLYVGTASFDRTDRYNVCTKKFREIGCEIRRLDVSEKDTVPTMEVMKDIVTEWADVIMCSGGNTLHALLRWKEVGLDLLLKEASLKGVVLCGGSAGAGCWFSSLQTDSLRPDNTKNKELVKNELSEEELSDWDYAKISALGFVDAMCVPHFDKGGTNGVGRVEDAERILQKSPTTPAIGVDENAALVVVGNEALALSGDGKVSLDTGSYILS